MTITPAQITLRLSGGASNANPLLSLGGAVSSVAAGIATLFDNVSQAECVSGDDEFRLVYLCNESSTPSEPFKLWVSSNTPSPGSAVWLGLGASGINGTEPAIANENTAPAGLTFIAASTSASGLTIGAIPAGGRIAVWIRWSISAGAAAFDDDTVTLQADGGYTE